MLLVVYVCVYVRLVFSGLLGILVDLRTNMPCIVVMDLLRWEPSF